MKSFFFYARYIVSSTLDGKDNAKTGDKQMKNYLKAIISEA